MAFYKHYSFDLWLTLIKSNPTFKQERTKYFFSKFNSKNKSIDEVTSIFRHVDLMVNAINEKSGKNVDSDEMYLMVISMMNDFSFDYSEVDLRLLDAEMENLLLTHMPLLYCNNCLPVLSKIKEENSTTNILSNTGFIKGKTLRKVLNHLELDQYIDFQLYSDEVRMSKPNSAFFKLMLNTVNQHKKSALALEQIIHIGDNPIADVNGAKAVGIKSLLINSNNLSILHLLS